MSNEDHIEMRRRFAEEELLQEARRRATERPNVVCARMARDVLQTHMPGEQVDLSGALRVR